MKSFYLGDFFKNFLTRHNIPLIIYLFVNLAFICAGTVFAVRYAAENISPAQGFDFVREIPDAAYFAAAAAAALLYFVILSLSLSPIGEWILRMKFRCRKIRDRRLQSRIFPLFQEVYSAARAKAPAVSGSVRVFVEYSKRANAFALGRKSVCVTTGLLRRSDDEIKGILGHEFGHLAHKDTDLNLVVNIAGGMTDFIFLGVWLAVTLLSAALRVLGLIKSVSALGADEITAVITGIAADMIVLLAVYILLRLWHMAGNLLLMARSRSAEYRADGFSAELGYAQGLISFLHALPDSVRGRRNPFKRFFRAVSTVGATHPQTWKRIEAVEKRMNKTV